MKLSKFLSFIVIISFLSSCLTDLRTDFNKTEGYSESNQQKGRTLIKSTMKAVGIEKLNAVDDYTVQFSDEFLNFSGFFANPYKDKKTQFKLDFMPKTFNGKMTYLTGKEQGRVSGMNDWKTYTITNGEEIYIKDKRTNFWLPTYQYFIEFPLRILEADKISYAGEETYDGKLYDLVLASWKSFEPQKEIDQYLIWISKETGRIEILQYTIRDYYGFIKGVTFMEDYKTVDGIQFPTNMRVKSRLNQRKLMHNMRIHDMTFNFGIE